LVPRLYPSKGAPYSTTAILELLYDHPNDWFSIKDIAEIIDFVEATVRKRVRELEWRGKIRVKLGDRGKKLLQFDQY